ncbi:MAG: NADH-quinone oxidoreductase subunit J [Ignavibacteriales bacterium]|nr:NADH-quinone oxidoreductase subunit J [Ignavibacteriales bacterium]
MTIESILFYVLSAGAVGSALFVVSRRNPVVAALWLIFNFFCLAGLYLSLHAQFIAVIQIIVYAGAIMVLFLFVIMLLNLGDERRLVEGVTPRKVVGGILSIAVLVELWYVFLGTPSIQHAALGNRATEIGTVEHIGAQLFTKFLLPFEVTSLLLTAAIVGAIVLAKRKLD